MFDLLRGAYRRDPREIDFVKKVEGYGYTAREYSLARKGYNLTLHRISGSPASPEAPGKKVVYIQHGLCMYSAHFILQGVGKDIALLLADEGYDVWLGNLRGNTYSRPHESTDAFWNFSFEETALEDISFFIDATLAETGQEKLVYIGYSLGTNQGLVLLSKRPEYNKKISLMIKLAPVVFWNDTHVLVYILSQTMKLAGSIISVIGIGEVFPETWFIGRYARFITSEEIVGKFEVFFESWSRRKPKNILEKVYKLLSTLGMYIFRLLLQWLSLFGLNHACFKNLPPGIDFKKYDLRTIRSFIRNFPAGTSTRTAIHLAQNVQSRKFQAFDFKRRKNMEIYGSEKPPRYNLENVDAPVVIFYGDTDIFCTKQDIETLKEALPNVVGCKKIAKKGFNHFDFIGANDLKEFFFNDLLEVMKKYCHS